MFAADAVARLSGSVGVAAVTAGPGLTNTITAVKNAQMAESPILLIGGAAATLSAGNFNFILKPTLIGIGILKRNRTWVCKISTTKQLDLKISFHIQSFSQ